MNFMQNDRISKIIKKRSSIRNYINAQISDDDLRSILEAALYAPSGKNRQPWRFVVIKKSDVIRSIAKATVYSRFIRTAPVVVLVFLCKDEGYPIEKDMIGIGACVQNIILTATEKSYGSCIIGEIFDKSEEIVDCIGVDMQDYMLVCGIAIGRTNKITKKKGTKKLDNFILKVIE